MPEMRLGRSFYQQPTIKTSKQLLGKYLVRKIGKKKLGGMIVETEAYIGPDDKASHASFGRTKRCAPMYGPAGIAYVYFIYGMYWMLNIVTEEEEKPCAVLIRALEPISEGALVTNFSLMSARKNKKIPRLWRGTSAQIRSKLSLRAPRPPRISSGPGKLCQWMKIDGSFNGEDLVKSKRLWIEDKGIRIKPNQIAAAKRIGVDYAGRWAEKPWRFHLKDNPYVSKR